MVRMLLLLVLGLYLPIGLAAQNVGPWDASIQVMHSVKPSIPNEVFGGQTIGITQAAASIRASTDLIRIARIRLRYSAQLLPVVALSNVERYGSLAGDRGPIYVLSESKRAYGIGFVPIGIDIAADVTRRARLQFGAGAGLMWFSRNVPVAAARQRNFTAEWDAALLLNAGHDRWVQLGMRWKHISNGQTAWENPGIDNRMLFAGMSWRVHAPR